MAAMQQQPAAAQQSMPANQVMVSDINS